MSTNATISVEHDDGTVNTIYLHWDGYPEHALETLKKYYNTYRKAANLCALGDMSALYQSIECPPGHSFEIPKDCYSIFYGRDRGDQDCAPRAYDSVGVISESEEYNYIFSNGKWSREVQ